MKIGILSDCRVPTNNVGGHGLGLLALDLATGLEKRGHKITLYGGAGSEWLGSVRIHEDELSRARSLDLSEQDAWLDLSHYHDLSRIYGVDAPVVNWLVDLECKWLPPNMVVGNEYQKGLYPKSRLVPLGINVDNIPIGRLKREKAVFCHKIHYNKGYDRAIEFNRITAVHVTFVGLNLWGANLTGFKHIHNLPPTKLHEFIGGAEVLLSLSRRDAGGRVNLEAAAAGTPTLVLDGTGAASYVSHCVSGYICRDMTELVDAYNDLCYLKGDNMRQWVKETHDMEIMIKAIETQIVALADGERW